MANATKVYNQLYAVEPNIYKIVVVFASAPDLFDKLKNDGIDYDSLRKNTIAEIIHLHFCKSTEWNDPWLHNLKKIVSTYKLKQFQTMKFTTEFIDSWYQIYIKLNKTIIEETGFDISQVDINQRAYDDIED